jgi:hypothetical protein
MWVLQACVSIWSDYIEIHNRIHLAHAVDRVVATANVLRIMGLAAYWLKPWWVFILAVPCLGSFNQANVAKVSLNVEAWKWWHFMWHVTSGFTVLFVSWAVRSCEAQPCDLSQMCKTSAFF